jgi:hypothetical protein
MRQDQYEKLQALEEQLTDVFLNEAAPAKWPGAGSEPANWDQQTRGDRYWCKKNAVATMSLIGRVGHLVQRIQMNAGDTPLPAGPSEEQPEDEEATLDKEIATYEKQATEALAKFQRATGGKA